MNDVEGKGNYLMEQMLSAVYEQGSLRLLDPVELAESSQVKVQILAQDSDFQAPSFNRQLTIIRRLLASLENAWNDDLARELFPPILQADLHTLWRLGRDPHRDLCALLQLSAAQLQPEQITHEQISAIRFAIDHLAQPSLTEAEILASHERLTTAGLPPAFSLNTEAVQSYLDEL